MDGGGLKGTGTASIRVKDINDMPPSFTKDEWVTNVDETDGNLLPDAPILTVTVHDEDESNKFHYKVQQTSLTMLFRREEFLTSFLAGDRVQWFRRR